MDLNNNDGDKLFEQRNESSVLFSLDSLAQVSESNSESEHGFGGSGDESGLIDLNTLTQMGSSDQKVDDFAGGAPVFNSVKSKKEKKSMIGFIIVGVVLLLALCGGGVYYILHLHDTMQENSDEEIKKLAELQAQVDAANSKLEAANKEKEQLMADQAKRELSAEEAKRLEELMRQSQEAEAQKKAAEDQVAANAAKKDAAKPKTGTAKPADSASAAAPAKPKSGKLLSTDEVKSVLSGAAAAVSKCAKNGNLVVQFDITPAGKVTGMSALSGSFKGTNTEKCIITQASKLKFSESGAGAKGVKWNFKL